MEHVGFIACLDYPYVWMRLAIKSNGQEHYECVISCVDDDLVVCNESEHVVRNQIGKCFALKKGSIGPPTR